MQAINRYELFDGLDFLAIQDDKDFKEDSVREVIISPIIQALGYKQKNIVRSKSLKHPFLKVGSNKKIPVTLIPDYAFKVEGHFAWVLDAKSPKESVTDSNHIEQVYQYATHPEIESTYFALCNGREFVIYKTNGSNTPVLYFSINEIEHHWENINKYLCVDSFQIGKLITYETTNATAKPIDFEYGSRPFLKKYR